MIDIISPILVAFPFQVSSEGSNEPPLAGYSGIIDWTGLPCGVPAAVVVVTGQEFCLDAFDGKSFDLKAFDGKTVDLNAFDGKSFDLRAIKENCND